MGSQIRNKSPDDHPFLAAFAFSLGLLLCDCPSLRSCFSVELL